MSFVAGEYTFYVDASDPQAPTLGVFNAPLFGATEVYIRGGMNGWGTADALSDNGDASFSVEIELNAERYEFKVASEDWSTVNLGADNASSEVSIDMPYTLTQGSNANLVVEADEAGTYVFTVTGPDPQSPTVTITKK